MGLDACVIPKGDIFLNARVNDENLWRHILKNVKKNLKVLLIRHFTLNRRIRVVDLPITMTINSSVFQLVTVNDAQD